jgi:hypothetical protein
VGVFQDLQPRVVSRISRSIGPDDAVACVLVLEIVREAIFQAICERLCQNPLTEHLTQNLLECQAPSAGVSQRDPAH